ncbi:Hypothetical predicted protein [Mytilus galloprovincialis]|uniref:Uncharacterized protein n=1 Tax=Mytilus galloprovincialis TaxID=29158 RepID=A0A8B6D0S7_MYTGA|nr:Hypothetical predicted protein [Mytilus galloprovincialis]
MDTEMKRDDNSHSWIAPLPFKPNCKQLPNNRTQALHRARSFDASLRKDPVKRQHDSEFMTALIENGHAERASVLEPNSECWYLPLFGIYNPQKKDRIRNRIRLIS